MKRKKAKNKITWLEQPMNHQNSFGAKKKCKLIASAKELKSELGN